MKTIRLFLILVLLTGYDLVWAQTNTPAKSAAEQEIQIDSDRGYFDGLTNQMVYIGHVFVTDHVKAWLTCERLTVFLPPNGGNPTNIVAETNVVMDVLDSGDTNHITANKAVYTYGVVGTVTNEIVTFTGGDPMPKLRNSKGTTEAEPIIIDVLKKSVEFPGTLHMHIIQSAGSGTNSSPFGILK